MKKFCLLLLMFSLISVPAFAMKKILNDNSDRRVPSRCSGPVEEYTEEETSVYDTNYQPNQMPSYNSSYQMERYINYYKPLLSQDMRTELIGTTWYYPKYVTRYTNNSINSQPATAKTSKKAKKAKKELSKRYLREAADYYTQDTLGPNPDKAYPAGFEI